MNILECVLSWIILRSTDLIQRKCEKFVDQSISDGRFTNLIFISSVNACCNFGVTMQSVCVCFYFYIFNCYVVCAAFIREINYI